MRREERSRAALGVVEKGKRGNGMDPRHEDVFDLFACICMSDREMGDGLPYPVARCRSHFWVS